MRGITFRKSCSILKPKIGILLGLLLLLLPFPVLAGTFTAYGPQTFVRGEGKPITITGTFVVLDPTAPYTIRLSNSSPVTNEEKKERDAEGREKEKENKAIVTAEIKLNGKELFDEDDFRKKSAFLEKAVSLNLTNVLEVKMKGKPGSQVTITVIGVDNAPPTITATVSPLPNTAGWNNTNVTVTFTCWDATSGVAVCLSPVSVTTEGAGQIISGTATDRAGNSATATVTLNIDKTVPIVSSTIVPPPNSAGWNNSNPVVSFTATDPLSGIASISSPVTVTTEGQNQIITGTATDQAGNSATATLSVSLDKTAPTLNITSPLDGAQVTTSPVTVTATVADLLSGIASVTCNNTPATLSSLSAVCNQALTPGTNPIVVQVTDIAGNTTSSTITVTLNTNRAPVSNPGGPYQGNVGSPIVFNGSSSSDLDNDPLSYTWNFGDGATATSAAPSHTYVSAGTFTVTLTVDDGRGGTNSATTTATVATSVTTGTGLPPDPATVAPALSQTTATSPLDAGSFLYTGTNPIQTGVAPGTITFQRAAILRGRVLDNTAQPLPGVAITLLNHPEYGQTLSRVDGMFDLAVNGGGSLTVRYQKEGFPSAQRQINVPWQDYALVPDVILIPYDTNVTSIDFSSFCNSNGSCTTPGMQAARGSQITDTDGTRQATLFFPYTEVQMTLPDGTALSLTSFHVRATEYTVGPNGPKAMPANLPPSSGYTYAVELSIDEAVAAGATRVSFSQPVVSYTENFLGFPVGTAVPAGYYDLQKGQWIASANGRVIKVLSITNGLADLDLDGNGLTADAAALATLGVTSDELTHLAQTYTPGQTLWRVPITHFTSWDYNWPYGPPSNAIPPPGQNQNNPVLDKPKEECGSVIGCENQSLGEAVPVNGTSWRLHYRSQRTPGRKDAYTLNIPLSGAASLPASLQRMRVEVTIAGRLYQAVFAPAPNLSYTVTWDGKDVFGRQLQGEQTATVKVDYDYIPQYYAAKSDYGNSFARAEAIGVSVLGSRHAGTITLSRTWTEGVGAWDARGLGLGGWSLSIQHAYDPASHTMLLGDGRQRRAGSIASYITTTVAGNYVYGFGGDGGPATLAQLTYPYAVAVGPDGSLFIADTNNHRIRRVGPDGIIITVAGNGGNGGPGFSGDGWPATAARLSYPSGVAVGPDGSLYIADNGNYRIRRVGPDGIITTIAGNGVHGFSGDGGPATVAQLSRPFGVAVGPDGSLYIADISDTRIRRVGPDGIITTVAGNGTYGFSGDGGPATAAQLSYPFGVAVGPDGSLYIADTSSSIRRVGPDGIITTVAGNGVDGFSGDGGPATVAQLTYPYGVAVGPDGSLFISDTVNNRIRRVGPDGIITTMAGNDVYGFGGDGGPATVAQIKEPRGVALGPDGSLYFADTNNYRIRRVSSLLPGFSASDFLIPSEDGGEIYVFNGSGRHMRTLNALTGAVSYQFGYNADGYLISVTDGSGNVTTVERIGATPTAIVAPGGQRTPLTVSPEGWLVGAANPAGEAHTMIYSTEGLLQQFIDPLGNIHRFTYDSLGRLVKDEDPVGGSTGLARTEQSNGYTVTTTSALGRSHAYQVEQLPTGAIRRSVTQPSGAQTVTVIGTDGSEQTTNPDGSSSTVQYGPDPRWGMLAPHLLKRVRTVPGGQRETTTSTRTVSLADPNNLLSLTTLTDTVTVNGRTFTRSYDAAIRTMTDTSAEGRQTVSVLDTQGRVIRQELAPGVAPITFTYDTQGRVIENRQGAQFWTLSYDARYRVVARTDAAGRSASFLYDDADRITRKTLPNGAVYRFTYDANGNRTEVMLPSGARHALGYTPINLDASYTPPNNGSYLRTFNIDKQLTRTTLPAGRFTDQSYDAAGRVTGMSYPEAVTGFEYLANDLTDRVARITNTPVAGPAQDIAYSYNGSLISGMAASGAAPAQVSYTYDNDFFPTNMNLSSGTDTVQNALLWDRDGLTTGFGTFTFTRGGPGGALSQISDTASTTSYGYDLLARIATRNHQVSSLATYAMQLSYDTVGRITGKTDTAGGITHTYAYAYDLNGQLTEVQRDNVVSEHYAYDLNGNRTSRQLGSGPLEAASYDSQDRLIQLGAVAYQFNADGFLTQRGANTFQYNTRGQLLGATVGGQAITYGYDGLGRRVSRTNGSGTYQYLYGDPASHLVTAMRGPTGELTTLFYDTAGLLIALERGGVRYYVATDQVGTPRVVSSSTGALVKTVEYDSFGNLNVDSNPAFDLPIGYAGGLADGATGLVHFGFRDYDPASGRWTGRDPVLFGGGQGNLYVYVGNNPINNRDPIGLFCVNVTSYEGVGGGVGFCITGEGASVCGEIGFGVGASVGADIGGGLEKTGIKLVAELTAELGPLEIGVGGSLNSSGCLSVSPQGQLGPVTFAPGKVGLDNFKLKGPKIGEGAEAKIALQGCIQGKF
jgi:RHS repeat-associated protein